jgi:hypothetical protein
MTMAAQRNWPHAARLGFVIAMLLGAVLAAQGVAAEQASLQAGAGWRRFQDPALGFGLAYPPGWTVAAGCHGSPHCIALAQGAHRVNDYAVAFEIFAGTLERVANEKAVFRHGPAGWVADGRSASHPAEAFAGEGWHGIRAVIDCGIVDANGVHAAGECLWAVLSDGRHAIVVDTQGSTPLTDEIRRIIASVRFLRR